MRSPFATDWRGAHDDSESPKLGTAGREGKPATMYFLGPHHGVRFSTLCIARQEGGLTLRRYCPTSASHEGILVIKYLAKPIPVPFDSLYPDPNNPRLAHEERPGYGDTRQLFDDEQRDELFKELAENHEVRDLVEAILAHGWMGIDAIVVWSPPRVKSRYVVLEGNRRLTALRRIRDHVLPREEKKLTSITKSKKVSSEDVREQKKLVADIKLIIRETERLEVVPLVAAGIQELLEKLPKVLAVRHISGARMWGNYAEDLWLLDQYHALFRAEFGKQQPRWEQSLVNRIAEDASLTKVQAKRRLQACALYSHFRKEWEQDLPKGDAFASTDYYLFECIVKKPWLREQFGIGEDVLHMPKDREETLFKWVFKEHRAPAKKNTDGKKNGNVFYRHENVLVWEKMKRYDQQNGTGFASRFDVTDPDAAPHMDAVEAEWLSHETRRAPAQLLEELIRQLKDLRADTLLNQQDFLRGTLRELAKLADKYLAMMDGPRKAARA